MGNSNMCLLRENVFLKKIYVILILNVKAGKNEYLKSYIFLLIH